MGKNKLKNSTKRIIILAMVFVLCVSLFPSQPQKASALTNKEKNAAAENLCRGRIPKITPSREPIPAALHGQYIAWCMGGFLAALKPSADVPLDERFGDSKNPCAQKIYPSVKQAHYYCDVGYIYAYRNKDSIKPPKPPTKEEKLRQKARKECNDKGNIPGASNSEILRQACVNGYIAEENGKNKTKACESYSGISKQYCEVGFDLARGGSGAESDEDEEEQGCGARAGFSLSWIMCPIIEGGQEASERFYRDILQPLLKRVPINVDDPSVGGYASYTAWQSFRVLANIVLVGAMLILVYGMIRGGGGR